MICTPSRRYAIEPHSLSLGVHMSSFYRFLIGFLVLSFGVWHFNDGAKAFSGPQVSTGNLPVHHIHTSCTNGSPVDFFTNSNAASFLITEIWVGTSSSNSTGHSRLYLDGSPLVRLAAPGDSTHVLHTQSGIAVTNGQTLSCDRQSSWGVEMTVIGYYAHTP